MNNTLLVILCLLLAISIAALIWTVRHRYKVVLPIQQDIEERLRWFEEHQTPESIDNYIAEHPEVQDAIMQEYMPQLDEETMLTIKKAYERA